MQAVVLPGGLATPRLPFTQTVPKAMLPVAGRPFIDWLLERLAKCGYTQVVMCVAHLADQLRAHVGESAYGMSIVWSDDADAATPGQRLGTAGALRAALARLEPTFL